MVNLAGASPLKAGCDIMHGYTRSERFQSGIVSRPRQLDFSCSLTVRLNEQVQVMPKTPRGRGRGRGHGWGRGHGRGRGRGSPAVSTAPVPDRDAPVSGAMTALENVSIRGGGIGPADPAAAGPIILVAKNITN